jgi:RNA polymerase sigma factor (sigma-70 family)
MSQVSNTQQWTESDFRRLFLEHYSRIVGVLIRLLGDRSRSEELASDAFWRLYHQPRLQMDGNIGGWLYRTATNLGLDALRASRLRQEYEEAAGKALRENRTHQDPLSDLMREEKCGRVRAVLAAIRPAQAQLLILRASGLSYKELAEALEVKHTGVGTMLNRAEQEFRERYLQMHGPEEEL